MKLYQVQMKIVRRRKKKKEELNDECNPIKKKKKLMFYSCAALDKNCISNGQAMHLIASLTGKPISKSTIRRKRIESRSTVVAIIKEKFDLDEAGVIYWDVKCLKESKNNASKNIERLSINFSAGEQEKLLGVPVIPDSTGMSQADAIYKALLEWKLINKVVAMCFDTTSSNTGKHRGADTRLEISLNKK